MGKLINRIPGLRLLISKDTHLVFSIYAVCFHFCCMFQFPNIIGLSVNICQFGAIVFYGRQPKPEDVKTM